MAGARYAACPEGQKLNSQGRQTGGGGVGQTHASIVEVAGVTFMLEYRVLRHSEVMVAAETVYLWLPTRRRATQL